jgi:hypothetical protein
MFCSPYLYDFFYSSQPTRIPDKRAWLSGTGDKGILVKIFTQAEVFITT